MLTNSKICTRAELTRRVQSLREQGRSIVFTNGCFDLIHVGHVRYLADARREGDVLVVGVNSDASVRTIKPHNRPIIPEDQRAEVLAALECIDLVTIFDEPDPELLIRAILPDVLVKGADWQIDRIIGADIVSENGGRVERIRLAPGVSTTAIIEKIIALYPNEQVASDAAAPEK